MRRVGALWSDRFRSPPLEKIISATIISNATCSFMHTKIPACISRPMEPVRLSNYTSARVLTHVSFHQQKVTPATIQKGDNTKGSSPRPSHVQWYLTFICAQSNIAIFVQPHSTISYFAGIYRLRYIQCAHILCSTILSGLLRISTFRNIQAIYLTERNFCRKIVR